MKIIIKFKDRKEAGEKLSIELQEYTLSDSLIFAIPRGGLVVGAQIAEKLKLKLDLIIPRKIGAPFNTEIALGAVTQDQTVIYNEKLLSKLGLNKSDLINQIKDEILEINRRMKLYRKSNIYPSYNHKNIILVDDGIATGYTLFAAIDSIKNRFKPQNIIVAVPVAPRDIIAKLKNKVNVIKCLYTPEEFYAVGQFYENFNQISDEVVIAIMKNFMFWNV